jgi:hypothetical protein
MLLVLVVLSFSSLALGLDSVLEMKQWNQILSSKYLATDFKQTMWHCWPREAKFGKPEQKRATNFSKMFQGIKNAQECAVHFAVHFSPVFKGQCFRPSKTKNYAIYGLFFSLERNIRMSNYCLCGTIHKIMNSYRNNCATVLISEILFSW